MWQIFALICQIFIISFVSAGNECNQRDYGKGGTVCVCNTTYCDTFEPIVKTAATIVTRYESSKSGHRFVKQVFKFTNNYINRELDGTDGKVVTIDRNIKYQKIIGFGGAFTDAAAINILSLKPKLSQQIINDYYSQNGLSYTMGRIPIGGSDFSTRTYTYDDIEEDLELKNFSLTDEDIKYKIPLIKMATNLRPNIKLFGSPWSAPAWMKTNHNLTGKGWLKGDAGGPYHKAWAQYFVKFLNAYKSNGVELWGLTVQNEPNDGLIDKFSFNCMGFTAEQQRDFVAKDLGPTLKAANYGVDKLKLMVMDDQRPMLDKWADVIVNDTASGQYVSGIAFHWYLNMMSPPTDMDKVYEKYPDTFMLSTEACEGSNPFQVDKVSLGNWDRAETYAYDILIDLKHYTSGWVDWNLALDLKGGPNWVKNFVDAPIIVNATGDEYYKQPMYYSLAHFTRFLAPDSRQLHTNDTGAQILDTVVFETPDKATVLIALNRLNDTIPLTIADPHAGNLQTTVPAHSIQTYVWYQ